MYLPRWEVRYYGYCSPLCQRCLAFMAYLVATQAHICVKGITCSGLWELVWDARLIALHYLRSLKGFWFDIFVILPVPQVVFWLVVPKLIKRGEITYIMTVLLLIFLFLYLPKAYHSVCLMRRMQRVTGYIFGTVWWEFALNLIG